MQVEYQSRKFTVVLFLHLYTTSAGLMGRFLLSFFFTSLLRVFSFLFFFICFSQQSKEDIDKPKVQSLADILKELDAEEEEAQSDEDLELERRMEELLAGEMVGRFSVVTAAN